MTLPELLTAVTSDKRVCPQPQRWNTLWEMLPGRSREGTGWNPPLPLILAAWWETTDEQKRARFHAHLRWADEHGALNKVETYILSLAPQDWHTEN